jgi:MoaA/NifB/PqqE/SkfB family radical SAM enzyme
MHGGRVNGIIQAWGRILRGYPPNLSIEITRACPLKCPGCYAYGEDHLGGEVTLREVRDYTGEELVQGVLRMVREHKPLHLSIVGGEPLVRYRELNVLLPLLATQGVYTQVVTSAVRPIPQEWAALRRFQVVVSIDGLQPEHDVRRAPATYERIKKHIVGHAVTVHCTVTRQQATRRGYVEEFVQTWSANPNVRQIWISLYTPQIGESSAEMLTAEDRRNVLDELALVRTRYPKLTLPKSVLAGYVEPPASPSECIFARTTTCFSADLNRRITPCQFGGKPDCSQCGCIASAGLAAVGRHRLFGYIPVGAIFYASDRVGALARRRRDAGAGNRGEGARAEAFEA